jgi:uncharacterized protein (DUF983 family)
MAGPVTTVVDTLRDGVPFLVVTVFWVVVGTLLYGLFLATKPPISYDAWVHASVFVPSMIGLFGHALQQALKTARGT